MRVRCEKKGGAIGHPERSDNYPESVEGEKKNGCGEY